MKVNLPENVGKYLWTRYIPNSAYKTYVFAAYLNQNEDSEADMKEKLLEADFGEDDTLPKVIEEKKKVLENVGIKYPETREEELEMLQNFGLLEKDDSCNSGFRVVEDIKRPEEVLDLDEEEMKALENIKFEVNNSKAISGILSLILTNGKRLDCSVSHITNMTGVKIADIRTVLDFLVNEEKSLTYKGTKSIDKLKKQDRVILNVNEPVFSEKRFVVE